MSRRNKRRRSVGFIYGFAVTWLVMAAFLPMYKLWAVITALCASILVSSVIASASGKKAQAEEEKAAAEQREKEKQETEKAAAAGTSYSPEVSAIMGNRALSEMGRLYMSIKDPEVRGKINEIMRITDKIAQDAISDPSDIPQIKKFMNYYLPTTIKLLNAYDRMSAQGIEGENLDKSMKSINDMLDTAIEAYKKRLDSLFANQALDIETDIQVMNTMLAREGLSGGKDFEVKADAQ